MLENEVIETQVSTSDSLNDAPVTTEEAKVEIEEQAPDTVTLTKAELDEQKNAVAAKERARAERKSSREMQAIRDELEQLRNPVKSYVSDADEPKLEDYDDFVKFAKAQVRWERIQGDNERQQAESEKEQGAKRNEAQKRFTANSDKFRESTPDYDEVMAEIADVDLSYGMSEAVLDSDLSAQLTYYFGKNQDEFDRINALSPLSAAREIGKIEAKILSKPIQTSSAPSPINPVTQSKATITKDPEKMSDEEWYAQEKRAKARK